MKICSSLWSEEKDIGNCLERTSGREAKTRFSSPDLRWPGRMASFRRGHCVGEKFLSLLGERESTLRNGFNGKVVKTAFQLRKTFMALKRLLLQSNTAS